MLTFSLHFAHVEILADNRGDGDHDGESEHHKYIYAEDGPPKSKHAEFCHFPLRRLLLLFTHFYISPMQIGHRRKAAVQKNKHKVY